MKISFLPYLCGYKKGYSTYYALVCLIEKWKKILDKKGFCWAVLMDLSKAFDIINYLSNRWQRTKINKTFSSWVELMQGVPQGSVLKLLLINIYLNDLFLLVEFSKVCNFADDTTFFCMWKRLKFLINRLEHDSLFAIEWLKTTIWS